MRLRFVLVTFLFAATASAARFDDYFLDKTMRVDYFHTGNHGQEVVALDQIVSDGPWAGSRTRLTDALNLGEYFFNVVDRETNSVIYSRGFNSVFGEWMTTDEAKARAGTFEESVRFPWPKKPVQLVLKHRDRDGAFQQVWSTLIDPASRTVNSAERAPAGKVWSLIDNGPPSEKVDLLVIGEGYSAAEQDKLHADVKRLAAKLFATEPFKSRQKDFNVRVLDLVSGKSGVHRPRTKADRRTATGVEYNIFDSERYVLSLHDHMLRDVASAAPYDFIEIIVNEKTYGGGGIFRDQATTCVDSAFAEYIFVHEFGHHFAALADEYYSSPVAYESGGDDHPEPWEPNVTALHDPAKLKWRDLVDPATPIPTPWAKEAFDTHAREVQKERARIRAANEPESVMDRLFTEERAWETKYLATQPYSGKVGAFEGAAYESKGLYRPELDCIMFTRDEVGFCRVCRRAIERIIDEYSRP